MSKQDPKIQRIFLRISEIEDSLKSIKHLMQNFQRDECDVPEL